MRAIVLSRKRSYLGSDNKFIPLEIVLSDRPVMR